MPMLKVSLQKESILFPFWRFSMVLQQFCKELSFLIQIFHLQSKATSAKQPFLLDRFSIDSLQASLSIQYQHGKARVGQAAIL